MFVKSTCDSSSFQHGTPQRLELSKQGKHEDEQTVVRTNARSCGNRSGNASTGAGCDPEKAAAELLSRRQSAYHRAARLWNSKRQSQAAGLSGGRRKQWSSTGLALDRNSPHVQS